MNKLLIQGAALVLMLLALPLTSLGTTTPMMWAIYAGLGAITVGGLMTPVLHFVGDDGDDDGGNKAEQNNEEKSA